MEELIAKYSRQHKDVPRDWKIAVINKADDGINYVDKHQNLDWLYDDSLYYLFDKSTRKVLNLCKRMGYAEPPCETAKNIIKYWKYNKDFMWTEETAHLF